MTPKYFLISSRNQGNTLWCAVRTDTPEQVLVFVPNTSSWHHMPALDAPHSEITWAECDVETLAIQCAAQPPINKLRFKWALEDLLAASSVPAWDLGLPISQAPHPLKHFDLSTLPLDRWVDLKIYSKLDRPSAGMLAKRWAEKTADTLTPLRTRIVPHESRQDRLIVQIQRMHA